MVYGCFSVRICGMICGMKCLEEMFMLEQKKMRSGKWNKFYILVISVFLCMFCMLQTVSAAEPIEVSYYYEEVCASCDGTKDFYELYNRVFSLEDKQTFKAKISTYNVFMDSFFTSSY